MKFTSPLLLLASCFLARQSLARELMNEDVRMLKKTPKGGNNDSDPIKAPSTDSPPTDSLARELVKADDSVMTFRFYNPKQPYRSCIWVSEDTESRCGMTHKNEGSVYTHCPFTCKDYLPVGFAIGTNQSDMHFPVLIPKGGVEVYKFKKCIWIPKGRVENCRLRCARTGITETCPLTCAACPSTTD